MYAVELDNVTKTFGTHRAVDDLSLAVPAGTIYGFIGPNGSGKTTTLRMIMRILHPDRGRIRVLGAESFGAATDRVGYLPEERGLYKKMKVRDILRFYAELKSCPASKQEVNRWLEIMQLASWGDKKVEALSKGMAQKVQFIGAVIAKPELVLLDEPFTGLDDRAVGIVSDRVRELAASGAMVVLATHDLDLADGLITRVALGRAGRLLADELASAGLRAQYRSVVGSA